MRVQEGSDGCRVAQEREVIRGCAEEVRGDIAESDGGRTSSLFGKRTGEMKDLTCHSRLVRITTSTRRAAP